MWKGIALAAVAATASAAQAQSFAVDPAAGNNTFTAVFDAPLGERITAMSSAVSCQLKLDALAASGHCEVPLTAIKVDNEPDKTDHFYQWSTNKKLEPEKCKYEVALSGVKLSGPLAQGQKVTLTGQAKVTVCGRARDDGGAEPLTGNAILLPNGKVRVRVELKGFNRERYGVSPKNTEGWLARVQQLAPVVNATGDVEVNLFAAQEGK